MKNCAGCGLKKDVNSEGLCIDCSMKKNDAHVIKYVEQPDIKEYHSRLDAPLAFHNFTRYVAIPLGIIRLIYLFYNEFAHIAYFNWLYIADLIYFISTFVLLIITFVGFLKWKFYGYRCFFSYLSVQIIYSVFSLIVYLAYGLSSKISTLLASLTGIIIYTIAVSIYYKKRKLLFAPYHHEPTVSATVTPSEGRSMHEEPTSQECIKPQIMYCRKCGTQLPSPDSAFCHKCGTAVITS